MDSQEPLEHFVLNFGSLYLFAGGIVAESLSDKIAMHFRRTGKSKGNCRKS